MKLSIVYVTGHQNRVLNDINQIQTSLLWAALINSKQTANKLSTWTYPKNTLPWQNKPVCLEQCSSDKQNNKVEEIEAKICPQQKQSHFAAKALGRLQSQFVERVCAATMGAVRSDFVRPGVGAFSAHPTLHEHGILRCQDAEQPFLLRQGKINPVECRRGMTGFRLVLLLGGREGYGGRVAEMLYPAANIWYLFLVRRRRTHTRAACVV